MMNSASAAEVEGEPIETNELCELCGCAIEDFEALIYLRAADMIAQWELADPRDAWRHTGEPSSPTAFRNSAAVSAKPAHRTPQATINAFWYVIGLDDPEYLKRWFARHPLDVAALVKLYERKNAA